MLSAEEITFLRDVGRDTWNLLSGAQLNQTTSLLRSSVNLAGKPGPTVELAPPTQEEEYTNPALLGNWLTSIVAARDLGLLSEADALKAASKSLDRLRRMAKYKGFFFRWYDTETGEAITSPKGQPTTEGYVSTVDNGWLAQGLLTASAAFPSLDFRGLADTMEWDFLYNKKDNVLYNGYQVGKDYSTASYMNLYSGPRIADYMAIGSEKVPGALWWGLARTPPKERRQRQVPQGRDMKYKDPQNNQTYTVYQALAPALVMPEQTMAPDSLGLNNRNTALAHGAYGDFGAKSPVWGWVPATTPPDGRYTNYGAPDLAIDHGEISSDVAAPYAAFLALPIIPRQSVDNLDKIVEKFPTIRNQYGFLDSVRTGNKQISRRFMAISQTAILMAIDNAVNHNKLQTYLGATSYAKAVEPYLAMEHFTIQGLEEQ